MIHTMSNPEYLSSNFQILDDYYGYLSEYRLYYAYFQSLPSVIEVEGTRADALIETIERGHVGKVIARHEKTIYNNARNQFAHNEVLFLTEERMLFQVEDTDLRVLYPATESKRAKEIVHGLRSNFTKPGKEKSISLLVSKFDRLTTTPLNIRKPKLSLSTHYNDDLLPIHQKMLRELKKKNQSGLFLLHGQPGTGKSTYLKHLIHNLNKKVIFVTNAIAATLETPTMTKFLIDHENCIFVIEDAEELLTSREMGRNSSIAMLLNLTDGLLGESLGIQIIATFNTEQKKIDKALLRKGRLSSIYEFKTLSLDKTVSLMSDLGHQLPQQTRQMTLAEIYNHEEPDTQTTNHRTPIGFRMNND
jgi:hypothetical protein